MEVTSLPQEILPECWEDDMRMSVVFAPFRHKNLNPVDWESKMTIWKDLIAKWCISTNRSYFTIEDIKTAFRRKNKTPSCIETVFDNMLQSGVIQHKANFMKVPQNTWLHYGVKQVAKLGSWTASAIISSFVSVKPVTYDNVPFVHMDALSKQAIFFLNSLPENAKIGTINDFQKLSSSKMDNDTLTMIMNWLISHNLAFYSLKYSVYKLAKDEQSKVTPLHESEVCLHQISQAERRLEDKMKEVDENILETMNKVKQNLANKNKNMAMHYLKQKKGLEIRLTKLSNTINSLLELSERIKQTHVDAEVIQVYRTGLSALKNMESLGLKEDSVYDTMDDLKDAMDEYKRIEEAISSPLDQTSDLDELEEELNRLTLDTNDDNSSGNVSTENVDMDMKNDLPPQKAKKAKVLLESS